MTPDAAEIVGLQALGWLAGESEALDRFLALTSIDPADLREAAGSRDMGLAVIDFLLADEPLMLAFCEIAETRPRDLHLARHALETS